MKEKSLKKKSRKWSFAEQWPMIIMVVPFMVIFMMMVVIPIIASIVLSFTNFDAIQVPKLVGFDNYMRMFVSDDVFPIVFKNTLVIAVVVGPIGFLMSFVLAWFVNEFSSGLRTVLSFMFYAPSLVGNAYFVWQVLFSGDAYGYINNLLLSIGIITEPVQWLKTPEYILVIVIIVQVWQSMGVSFLSNISGLQNISRDIYEAGAIDGIKNRWQELRYITLPSMSSMLLFSAVMQISGAFSVSAVAQALAGYPSVQYAVDTIVSYMTDVGGTRFEMGYASAISVVLLLMMVIFRTIVGKLLKIVTK